MEGRLPYRKISQGRLPNSLTSRPTELSSKTRHTLYELETTEREACTEPLLSKTLVNQSGQNHSLYETPLKPSRVHRYTGKEIPAGRF